MDFIKDLHEARMTKDDGSSAKLTYSDCMERLYLILLVLETMRQFPEFALFVKSYCNKTAGFETLKHYRIMGTDLYNFLYFLAGPQISVKKLKDPEAAEEMKKIIRIPLSGINSYINSLKNGQVPTLTSKLFIDLESSLKIQNPEYKSVRRFILNFDKTTKQEKTLAVTKLLFAVRAKLRNSDIIDDFEKLAAIKDLESTKVKDTEPTISVPDIVTTSDHIALYRYIVGANNLQKTKLFLDSALAGKSVPQTFVQGYLPAIKMIDDIVSAGPAFVQQLKALQKRANRN